MAIQTSVKSEEFRETIQESRQRFLNILCNSEEIDEDKNRQNDTVKRKPASKKISFKVKKTSSTYRKNFNPKIEKTSISASSVAEIASKFNEMIENNSTTDDIKLKKLVKRLNSFNNNNVKLSKQTNCSTNENNNKEQRKPSIKKKPVLNEKKPVQISRSKSIKTTTTTPNVIPEIKENEETNTEITEKTRVNVPGFVKAAIRNFERKSLQPITTKRSLSEFHLKEATIETNRRKSCKPDLTSFDKNEERQNDQMENCKSEPNLVLPHRNEPEINEPNSWSSSSTLHKNENPSKSIEENRKSEELCYFMTDIANKNLTEIEENKQQLYEEYEQNIKPNLSFLWTKRSSNCYQDTTSNDYQTKWSVQAETNTLFKTQSRDLIKEEIYEELDNEDGYEPFDLLNYEEIKQDESKRESEYEYLENNEENIYETLPSSPKQQTKNEESISNCYESIYNNSTTITSDNNYESIYFRQLSVKRDNSERDIAGSIVSSEQKTNSLYGTSWLDGNIYSNGSTPSDISFSDKSEWIDVSENEEDVDGHSKIIIVREATKNKKSGTSWSQQYRQQWSKNTGHKFESHQNGADSESDHHYETLQKSDTERPDFPYDSFESDVDSDDSFENLENHGNVDLPLPAVPNSNDVLTRLAASASKHMRKFTKNLTMTRNDISKSLTRITRRKSKNDISEIIEGNGCDNINNGSSPDIPPTLEPNPSTKSEIEEINEKNKTLSRKGFLNKIRRSIIMSPEQAREITSNFNKGGKSTFYLTPTINVDDPDESGKKTEDDSGISLSPVDRDRSSKTKLMRPQNPPPPAPIITLNEDLKKAFKEKRSTSWYAEMDLCKSSETAKLKSKEKQPTSCWYDEVGLYQKSNSTPSTSSAENSGTNTNITISTSPTSYSNIQNQNNYYNDSIQSMNNDTKNELSVSSLPGEDIQMMLQNEPLYQFYDAAVLESVYSDGISDFDSDNYEDFERRVQSEFRPSPRPSAMELIVPKRNSLAFSKTLWCEIPEVLQSSVLSTLSTHQKKLQEAKFEMVTSEASYLNSLNVLNDHFIENLRPVLSEYEFEIVFGKIDAVRKCSDELLLDLEKCWQDNILLHGVCDIIKKHAEENFSAYIPYCENHMLLDQMMKKLKERPVFVETLKQLESSPICQCLSLYSFLMLPMQRITRWPLLLDAVLKRLEQHDPEYVTSQYVLATLNKIVNQCNEAARNKERELEMLKIESKMEFGKGVTPFDIVVPNRWLVRSGNVTHMQPKSEEMKLTFGKKISKVTLHLFLFNDLLVVTKPKSDNAYSVLHHCSRNFTELSTSDQLLSVPGKDLTGKYLFFLTILENQKGKTVEFLLSCSSESDKQRWIEALSPPKSEDPEEVIYECWDCPQVTVIHNYISGQPDELSLSKGDVINVSRKMADGWFQGERIRDGQTGWFPSNYCIEIANPHVRARNLKQRYRLLTFSENYFKGK